MVQFLLNIGILTVILIIVVVIGVYFTKNPNAAEKVKESLLGFHKGLGTIGIALLLIIIFYFYSIMIQNVAPFMETNLNMPNPYGVLLGFVIFSIIANSLGAIKIQEYLSDKKVTGWEWAYTLVFFLLAISAEGIIVYYGYIVHIWYYDFMQALYNSKLQSLNNPILGYTNEQKIQLARKINDFIYELKAKSWQGRERMYVLILEAAFNLVSIFTTTIGFVLYEIRNIAAISSSSPSASLGSSGGGPIIPRLSSAPNPFSP